MMEDPRNIGIYTHLLFMAKNIERIGDHATNIAENLYYLVHGTPLTQARAREGGRAAKTRPHTSAARGRARAGPKEGGGVKPPSRGSPRGTGGGGKYALILGWGISPPPARA